MSGGFRPDVAGVRDLVDQRFPAWRGLPVRAVASSGTVNAIFRIGDGLVARFPLVAASNEGGRGATVMRQMRGVAWLSAGWGEDCSASAVVPIMSVMSTSSGEAAVYVWGRSTRTSMPGAQAPPSPARVRVGGDQDVARSEVRTTHVMNDAFPTRRVPDPRWCP